ncbi:hypothetical protein ACI6PS_07765 [Flavobacterium sp. PLA-1-15]|uniref:hypothetical protein n=1 Tax=Flavobacterium sp. PLA-1-15 TaxID=3380533 RepID=UPI003B7826FC
MNKIILWTILPFLTACSTDSFKSGPLEDNVRNYSKAGIVHPYNPANGWDRAGQLHNELSESYVLQGYTPLTVQGTLVTVDSIAQHNTLFQQLKGNGYIMPASSLLEQILLQSKSNGTDALSNTSLSSSAKAILAGFIDEVRSLEASKAEYADTYNYIVAVEESIQKNGACNKRDRELLLITTAITRHAAYFARKQKKKPRDKDWDLVVANIVAATGGAEQSAARAAIMAATAGIVANY